ncbi:hypothetical protein LCGC14_0465610 [marine sediment metagenome]|uniref:Uncharacterized protein n=1 Tax=marine sediment metagenome TaxID=412755 RepID=A0A0F9SWJ5_9ZZZZ
MEQKNKIKEGKIYCSNCDKNILYEYCESDFDKGYILVHCSGCNSTSEVSRMSGDEK